MQRFTFAVRVVWLAALVVGTIGSLVNGNSLAAGFAFSAACAVGSLLIIDSGE